MNTQLLSEIESELKSYPDFDISQLNPPATQEEIAALQSQFQLPLPASLVLFLKWHNGQAANYFEGFTETETFMSTHEIISAVTVLNDLLACGNIGPDSWNPNWVPFLDNGAGDHLCVDLSSANGEHLVFHDHMGEAGHNYFKSLADWGTDFLKALRRRSRDARERR